jgi:serine/threonine protein kinase
VGALRHTSYIVVVNVTASFATRRFSQHIVAGVDYLHSKGIIHRDIKGANILVSGAGVAKLADFGCSKQLAGMCTASIEESLKAIRGSVPWMAPEVIKQSGHGRSSDIWSVGATVIEMGKLNAF